ncbi:MAG: hypothetical protein CVU49_06635 [Candidatus Cloacimonetes bacterium HGW-Cloacimonetes-2]|jgi:hypothetical protein|nr:MAG: hypothetical protein CVU49_06635 [Candidatus Cloacimonetes bacterium HGW-Cloacimonetes-2]
MAEQRNIFFAANESMIATLGKTYLDSFLSGAGLTKLVMVLTNQRLYVKGKTFILGRGKVTIDEDYNVNDLTGTSYEIKSFLWLRILIILAGIAGLIPSIAVLEYSTEAAIPGILITVLFTALLVLLAKDRSYLGIFTGGTKFIYPMKKYRADEIMAFRQQVGLLIEYNRNK